MVDVKPRRADYVEQTRMALLDAAEELFFEQGYHGTSLDAVAAAARFTKGAVYRHFADKRTLFIAVFERVEMNTISRLPTPQPGEDSWDTAMSALEGFLDACTQPMYRRIILEEGPTVLGSKLWRELDQRFTGHVLQLLLRNLMDDREIAEQSVERLARLVCAVVGEAVFLIADAEDRQDARSHSLATLRDMFTGLRQPSAGADQRI